MLGLYKFYVYYGRMGRIEATFVKDQDDVKNAIGRYVYFGEILGKHSEVSFDLEENQFELMTDDQDFCKKFLELKLESGYNPFDYFPEDEEDEDDQDEDDSDEDDSE